MRTWPWSRPQRHRTAATDPIEETGSVAGSGGQDGPGGAPEVQITDVRSVEVQRVRDFAEARPVQAALMAEYVESLDRLPFSKSQMLCVLQQDELAGLCLVGGNLVPLGMDSDAFAPLAEQVRRRGRRYSSVVGEADQVLSLWPLLRPHLGTPREVRAEQPSLAIDHDPLIAADARVREAEPQDLDILMPACVSMFTEEVGYSPLTAGGGYERRIRSLVDQGRSLVRIDDGPHGREVVFKAELGTVGLGVAQVQGVWVHPRHRGRGLSAAGVAAVVEHTRARLAPTVSLYVNSYNTAALATYRRVGFRRVGTFATVLL